MFTSLRASIKVSRIFMFGRLLSGNGASHSFKTNLISLDEKQKQLVISSRFITDIALRIPSSIIVA